MSWQVTLHNKLRSRDWYNVGVLFESVEADIPLHKATRWYIERYQPDDVPSASEARWKYFRAVIASMGVERRDRVRYRALQWNEDIRLGYVAGKQCAKCHGPVIRRSWSSGRLTICLACEKQAKKQVTPFIIDEFVPPVYVAYEAFPTLCTLSLVLVETDDLIPVFVPLWDITLSLTGTVTLPKSKLRLIPVIKPQPLPQKEPLPQPAVLPKSKKRAKPKPSPKPPAVIDVTGKGFTSINQIRKVFFESLSERVPSFQADPRLRKSLHRALEAGIMEEYRQMMNSKGAELMALKYQQLVNGSVFMDATVFHERGQRWVIQAFTPNRRKYYNDVLEEAYGFGALTIFLVWMNNKIEPLHGEIIRLIAQRTSKMKTPGETRQRWGTPVKTAKNVIQRWFNR